jgi:hypothetical protein
MFSNLYSFDGYYDTNNGKHDENNVAAGTPGATRIGRLLLRN